MQVTETLSEGLKREYKVVVLAGDIEQRVTDRLTELAKEAQMPGFRPGKVPVTLLRKTHGKNVLGEILEVVVNDATSKTLTDNEIRPATQPSVEITKFEEGTDLEYNLVVEILPTIEMMDFGTLKLERYVAEVPEEDLDKRIEHLAEQMRNFEDAEAGREAADGDAVIIDFKGSVDGEPFEGGAGEDFNLRLGSGQFIPGFEEQLLGRKSGDECVVKLTFPEDYNAADLAGKEAEFEVKMKSLKVAEEAKIDDALAEKLGLENLDGLRDAVRKEVEGEYGQVSRARLKRVLLDSLDEHHNFDVPPGMVDLEFEQIWEQMQKDLEQQGKDLESLEKPEEEARAEFRVLAERRVRLGLLLTEVGQSSNLDVSADEVNRAIMEQARQFPGQEQQVFEYFKNNQEMQAQVRAPILEDKVVDYIVEIADVTEKTVSLEELLRDPDEEAAVAAESAAPASEEPAKKKTKAKKKKKSDEAAKSAG